MSVSNYQELLERYRDNLFQVEKRIAEFLDPATVPPDLLRQEKEIQKQIDNLKQRHGETPARFVEMGDPANFDLDDYDECLDLLLETPGLVGVSVTISSECSRNFPKYLQKRLQTTLKNVNGSDVFVPAQMSLKASIGAIEAMVDDIKPYRLRLNTTDILLTVISDAEDRLARFWEKLSEIFIGPFDYWFLVLIIKETHFASPAVVEHDFAIPEFQRKHVVKWVTSIVDTLAEDRNIRRNLIRDWTDSIMRGCSCVHEQKLYPDRVYEHIEMSLDLLKKKQSIDTLYKFFDEWKEIYAQTPP
jgi:hypothetical protein